ncbi:MAG TPA: NAD(P)-dependent glycerol-3-phosphate dehydrogenase [Clostridiales bacterium]|nr:NAD(P)-dependent glycerol-3-phosphate dehydrogenase [Clostridiales bacterium]
MSSKRKISVLGAGGWGTALAIMAQNYGNSVLLWSPFEEEIANIRRFGENKKLLPGVPVPPGIELTTEISDTADSDLVIMAVPSFAIKSTAEKLAPVLKKGTLVANAGKGLEQGTHRRFSQVISEALPEARVVALSGPSHAEEVARGVPTSIISASEDVEAAEMVQDILMNPNFRIYVNTDVIGVELGGALKNVIALAAGICDGLEVGDNTKAALMTRGLAEIARLGIKLGARSETFAGLSGMGDLIVTCGSLHSRNRRAGILIGQGHSPEEAVRVVGTVEGYHAALAGYELSRSVGVEMPITEQCWQVCYNGQPARNAIKALMERPRRHETEQPWK